MANSTFCGINVGHAKPCAAMRTRLSHSYSLHGTTQHKVSRCAVMCCYRAGTIVAPTTTSSLAPLNTVSLVSAPASACHIEAAHFARL